MKRVLTLCVFIGMVTAANAADFVTCCTTEGETIITNSPPPGAICKGTGDYTPALGEPGVRVRGDTFSVPVPKGFSVSKDERFIRSAPGGVVLMADKRAAPNLFLGSIVVVKIGPAPDFDPSDPAICRQMAEGSAAQIVTTLKAHRIVRTSVGNMCQWEVVDKEVSTRGCTGTVMYKTRDNGWVVTCNYDTRDSQTRAACGEVLAGWMFD